MFEIGDIVRFRQWSNKPWEEGTWFIIHFERAAVRKRLLIQYEIFSYGESLFSR